MIKSGFLECVEKKIGTCTTYICDKCTYNKRIISGNVVEKEILMNKFLVEKHISPSHYYQQKKY